MRKHIMVFMILLFVFTVGAWAEMMSEEIQALQSREAAGIQLTPGEKSQLEDYLTRQQRLNPWLDTSWGTDGWYSAVDQNSGGQAFSWMDISTTGTEIWPLQNQDDTWSPGFLLPFTFPFYWMQKDTVYVSANIILKFNAASSVSYSTAVPSNTQPPRIDPWCYDMYHLGADTVAVPSHYYYQAFGDSLFVVQFKGARYYNTTYRYDPTYAKDLEILLYSDGRVVFQYDSLRNIIPGSPFNSGIDDSVGTAGLSCGNSFSQGQAITFTPLTGVILANGQVSPISGNTSTNFVYQVKYRNTASAAPTSAQVYIDDVPYALVDSTYGAGNYYMGVNFYHTTTLAIGAHNYYFQFEYGGNTYRYPETGYLAGPTVYAPLSGNYDVGGGGNDFATIVAAVSALSGAGLAGPVVFNVYNGTYDGQVNLPNTIPGLSETNTLTIQAATGANPIVQNSTGTSSTTGNGFYITGADYITIKGFEITNCYYAGVNVYYATGIDSAKYITVEDNYIHDIAPTTSGYGIYVYNAKYVNLLNNDVKGDYYGINLSYSSYCLVANNLIYGQDYYGIRSYATTYTNYLYNSVYMNTNYATTNYATYWYNSTGCVLKNNIFFNEGSGSTTKYAIYLSGTLATYPVTSNYNDLYAPNSSVGYYTAARTTLAAWQTATALDANSISANPNFVSVVAPFDLHISTAGISPVNGAGTPVTEVTVDFDYEARDATTPDIGGDEFTPAAGVFLTNGLVNPPSGNTSTNFVYQINYANSGNLPPTSAQVYVDDVPFALVDSTYGSGNYAVGVNFYHTTTLAEGTHNYYFQFGFGGNTYRFPETGYLTGPTVYQALSGSYDIGGGANHYPTIVAAATVLNNAGLAGPVTFNVYSGTYDGQVNLPNTITGLSATNTLTIQAAAGASPVVLNSTGTSSTNGNGFYVTGADYITIKGFEITNCYYAGVFVTYVGTDSSNYVNIENNYFHDIAPASTGYGIYVYRLKYGNILNNEVQGDYYGIQVYYSSYNLIANNLIYGQDYYGLRNYYGTYNKFYYNSVYLNSNYATTNYVTYFYNSTGCDLKNNIFFNGGSGSTSKYAIYISGALATYPITSDYNDLYAPNSSVGYYTAVQTDLTAWRAATGLDANSISSDPNFLSVVAPFNLHINTAAPSPVDGAGTPVTEVTVDFDYEARNAITPDIGGDEFSVAAFYSVAVLPETQALPGSAGSDVAYYYYIVNQGNVADACSLFTFGAAWPTAIYDSAGTTIISVTPTIAVGDSEWVKVTHTVPDTAQGGDADTGYLRAVITADPAVADTASFTTSVPENIAMLITPEALADTANTGTTVLYNFYVVNTGNMEDDYALWTSGAAWDVTIYDASMSVVIDSIENLAAGDSCLLVIAHAIPLAPPDSLVDMGYLGAVSLTSPSAIDSSSFTTTAVIWPPVRIVLAPDTTTLVIPPGGGSFDYTLAITNYGSEAYQLRLWNEILLPNGHELSLWGVDVNMAPASGRFRDMTQFVPAGAPPGIYGYTMYIADRASWQVWDSSGFNFEKLAGDEAARHNRGWALLGWEEELAAEIILPTHYDLHRNFPNPFNPTTMLIYDLPEAGNVLLSVYDLIGREVVKLVDGYRSAGTHQAFFDGDNLSSGVYFAVFKVNNFSKVQKMLLLK